MIFLDQQPQRFHHIATAWDSRDIAIGKLADGRAIPFLLRQLDQFPNRNGPDRTVILRNRKDRVSLMLGN